MIRVVHPGSRIRMLTCYPSRIPDPGVKKAPHPGSRGQKGTESATLLSRFKSGKIMFIRPGSGSGALTLLCSVYCLFLFAGDSQLSDAVPPAAWHRRVGQLVIVIIDALRADFVLDHPSKVRIQ
jgi:hypothetical protein